MGDINPNSKAQVAINPDSEIIPVTRSNGVLLAHSVPNSGVIAGQSVMLQLDGWTWEDLTLKSPVAMHPGLAQHVARRSVVGGEVQQGADRAAGQATEEHRTGVCRRPRLSKSPRGRGQPAAPRRPLGGDAAGPQRRPAAAGIRRSAAANRVRRGLRGTAGREDHHLRRLRRAALCRAA